MIYTIVSWDMRVFLIVYVFIKQLLAGISLFGRVSIAHEKLN